MACQLLLEDCGLKYHSYEINLYDTAAVAEYRQNVNPKGKVPALIVDNEVITEAPAIVTAIAQLNPQKGYTGDTPLQNVRFYEWINFLSGTLHTRSVMGILNPAGFTEDASGAEAIRTRARSNLLHELALVDEQLAGSGSFALGDHLTGVDAYLALFTLWNRFFNLNIDMDAFPNYKAVVENVTKTAGFKAMLPMQD